MEAVHTLAAPAGPSLQLPEGLSSTMSAFTLYSLSHFSYLMFLSSFLISAIFLQGLPLHCDLGGKRARLLEYLHENKNYFARILHLRRVRQVPHHPTYDTYLALPKCSFPFLTLPKCSFPFPFPNLAYRTDSRYVA